ncbi:orotidine-5'-phosphate decarboxylase [Nanoarchaeota archaeon]
MNYLDKLAVAAKQTGSIVCLGLDPVPEQMHPPTLPPAPWFKTTHFFEALFREMKDQNVLPGAFKPNQGFYNVMDTPYECEGRFMGLRTLGKVFGMIKDEFPDIPIILDYKRGDIAKSSANYAREGFESWKADAVTISPYMGSDSVGPFTEYCSDDKGKGVYILNRTSNKGSADFQDLKVEVDGEQIPLYQAVAEKIVEWSKGKPGVGAVVGATSPEELSNLAKLYADKNIALLIPGVGSQGGSAPDITARLNEAGYDLGLARINSSSGITQPWAKDAVLRDSLEGDNWKNWAKVCVAELDKLNKEIGYKG